MSQRTPVSGPPADDGAAGRAGAPTPLLRLRRLALAGALGAGALLGSHATQAAEPGPDTLPIHIIALQTNDADDQAEALT